jgi:predicted dienelactone hydrolase
LRFVVAAIGAPATAHPKLSVLSGRLEVERIGMLGMSFGGGAVTEFCKVDTRCGAALNMDGGTYGRRQRQPLQTPYLAMVREGGHSLDYLLPASRSDFYRVEVRGAQHLDFTDDPIVLPSLKWVGYSGTIDAERMIEIINAVSLEFFDAYLRGAAKPRFDAAFPELIVQTNGAESRSAGTP